MKTAKCFEAPTLGSLTSIDCRAHLLVPNMVLLLGELQGV